MSENVHGLSQDPRAKAMPVAAMQEFPGKMQKRPPLNYFVEFLYLFKFSLNTGHEREMAWANKQEAAGQAQETPPSTESASSDGSSRPREGRAHPRQVQLHMLQGAGGWPAQLWED